jgi:hypothetical protein
MKEITRVEGKTLKRNLLKKIKGIDINLLFLIIKLS